MATSDSMARRAPSVTRPRCNPSGRSPDDAAAGRSGTSPEVRPISALPPVTSASWAAGLGARDGHGAGPGRNVARSVTRRRFGRIRSVHRTRSGTSPPTTPRPLRCPQSDRRATEWSSVMWWSGSDRRAAARCAADGVRRIRSRSAKSRSPVTRRRGHAPCPRSASDDVPARRQPWHPTPGGTT